MTQLWWKDPDLRYQFWSAHNCEYRTAVAAYFANYTAWVEKLPVPKILGSKGMLPGDFSATFEKASRKLGILGLNSTFLQISTGDFKGKLDMHVSQLNSVCEGDATKWTRGKAGNVLLTHQPPSWFHEEALNHFRDEIYPPGRFISHFCGHQHEPEASSVSEAGAVARQLRQGPSLFGLEKWNGATPQKRIHGYSAGQFIFEKTGGLEKLWPRIAILGLHGQLNIAPDHRYQLDHDCIVSPFEINEEQIELPRQPLTNVSQSGVAVADSGKPQKGELELLGSPLEEKTARKHLSACPRFSPTSGPQHSQIRLEEQSQFELELRKARCIWLEADWGAGKDGFLTAAFQRFQTTDATPDVFHINCDDAEDVDAFEALFPQQCGMPVQTFFGFLAPLKSTFVIFDGIHPVLCTGVQLSRLKKIVSAILDYCLELRIILSSRLSPEEGAFTTLKLQPLDVPDVRTYLTHHTDATPGLREADVVEKLHERSDGLPMHLDKMLKALKVSSLASVLEGDLEGRAVSGALIESTPKALIHSVANLARTQDKGSKRSFRLLKVLSVLPYGETLDALRHFLPAEPFFYENALQLKELALLDVVSLQQTLPKAGLPTIEEQDAPKLLKVPRQVRDYVQTLLSDDERKEIVMAGTERFFGRGWREGKIKLRNPPVEYREYLSSGAGNEFAIIHQLIAQGHHSADLPITQRAAVLGVSYCRHLESADRYRDLSIVAGALLQALEREEHPEQWRELAALHGIGLRMTDKDAESLKYFHAALEVEASSIPETQKASILLDIALAESCLDNEEAAIEAAKKAIECSKPEDAEFLYGKSIIAGLTLKGPQKARQLREIEREARSRQYHSLANTILLDLAQESEKFSEEVRHLDKVLESENRSYNHYRAIVAKARAVQAQTAPKELTPGEIVSLAEAYSYFHAQRFSGLFDRSHDALWQVFAKDKNPARLLKLFRHSSFIWRIRGNEDKERAYLEQLRQRNINQAESASQKSFITEAGYYFRRLRIVLIEVVAAKHSNS